MEQSKTPLTDEAFILHPIDADMNDLYDKNKQYVFADFARELERELQQASENLLGILELRAEIERLRGYVQHKEDCGLVYTTEGKHYYVQECTCGLEELLK